MIHATCIGRLGGDPEVRTSNGGTTLYRFRLACDKRVNGERQTDWVNVTMFGKLGELAANAQSGQRMAFTGTLVQREYTGRDGVKGYSLDLTANQFEHLETRQAEAPQPATAKTEDAFDPFADE